MSNESYVINISMLSTVRFFCVEIIGFLGCIFIIPLIVKSIVRKRSLTTLHILLISLICEDLWLIIINAYFSLPYYIQFINNPERLQNISSSIEDSELQCKIHGFCLTFITLCFFLTIGMISFERYFTIVIRKTRHLIILRKYILLTILFIMFYSSGIACLPLIEIGKYKYQITGTYCYIDLSPATDSVWDLVFSSIFVATICLQILIVTSSNSLVVRKLMKKPETKVSLSVSRLPVRGRSESNPGKSRSFSLKQKWILVLLILTLIFVISSVPATVYMVYTLVTGAENYLVEHILIQMILVKPLSDPWVISLITLIDNRNNRSPK